MVKMKLALEGFEDLKALVLKFRSKKGLLQLIPLQPRVGHKNTSEKCTFKKCTSISTGISNAIPVVRVIMVMVQLFVQLQINLKLEKKNYVAIILKLLN